jgi:uncharacterized cupin superfamily protein
MAKRIDPAALPAITGTKYPPPYDEPCRTRQRTRRGDPAGLITPCPGLVPGTHVFQFV